MRTHGVSSRLARVSLLLSTQQHHWLAMGVVLFAVTSSMLASCGDDDDDDRAPDTVGVDDDDATAIDDDDDDDDDDRDDDDATSDDDDATIVDDDDTSGDDDDATSDDDDATADDDDATGDDDDATGDDDDDTTPPISAPSGFGPRTDLPDHLDGLNAGAFEPPPSHRKFSVVVTVPSALDAAVTTANEMTITGVVYGEPNKVSWQSSAGSSGEAEFEFDIDSGSATFTAQAVPLEMGENTITFTADGELADGTVTTGEVKVVVTRVAEVELLGSPIVLNRVQGTCPSDSDPRCNPTFVRVNVPMRVDPGVVEIETLRLEATINNVLTTLADLRDDGDLAASQDEIAGDSVFSGWFGGLKVRTPKVIPVYAAYETIEGKTERFFVGNLEFVLTAEPELAESEQTVFEAVASDYVKLLQAGTATREEFLEAQREVVEALLEEESVTGVYLQQDGGAMFVYFTSGVNRLLPGYAPGQRAMVGNTTMWSGSAMLAEFAPNDESEEIRTYFRDLACPQWETEGTFENEDVTPEEIGGLAKASVVVLTSHGEAQGYRTVPRVRGESAFTTDTATPVVLFPPPRPAAGRRPTPAEPMEFILLAKDVSPEDFQDFVDEYRDAWAGQQFYVSFRVADDGTRLRNIWFTNKFIEAGTARFKKALVYFGACKSYWNGRMARAFAQRGASAFLGYTDYVGSAFAYAEGKKFFRCMTRDNQPGGDPKHILDCYEPKCEAPRFDRAKDRNVFACFSGWAGDRELRVRDERGIQNPSFDFPYDGFDWYGTGDARFVEALGGYNAYHLRRAGVISTGLGFTQASGSFKQRFCIPAGKEKIFWSWNYITSEWSFFCGDDRFQDTFRVTLTPRDGEPIVMQEFKVDDLCNGANETSLFDIPEPEGQTAEQGADGMTAATGWRHTQGFDVSAFAGQRRSVELKFEVVDRGDSFWDTAVMIDRVGMTNAPAQP